VIDKTGSIIDYFCKLSSDNYGTQFELTDGYARVIF